MTASGKPLFHRITESLKTWLAGPETPGSPRLDVSVLEDRILYSATAMPTLDPAGVDPNNVATAGMDWDALQEAIQQALDDASTVAVVQSDSTTLSGETKPSAIDPANADSESNRDQAGDASTHVFDASIAGTFDNSGDESTPAPTANITPEASTKSVQTDISIETDIRHEIAFIDATLDDLDLLISELQAGLASNVDLDFVFIDSQSHGVQFVSEFFANSQIDYDAVHIVSHGNADGFQLGTDWIGQSSWTTMMDQLQSWKLGLTSDADLLIYGCSVAMTGDGQAWLSDMSNHLGLDLSASLDLTGSAHLGGDWVLEFQRGVIETSTFGATSLNWNHVLATYTVTTTNDSGAGSLRQAITDANNNAGTDSIVFSVGSGSITISLSSVLPSITGTVILDGWTQPGFSSTPIIIIDANGVTGDGIVLTSTADNSVIRGLVLCDFVGDGIQINSGSSGNTIEGNYIGSFGAGGTDLGVNERNTAIGINILGDNNTIGGTTAASRNVIGGNQSHGVRITGAGAFSNIVLGNYIGTDATGLVDVGNSLNGIYIDSSATNNTIGGLTAASRNIIAGNDNAGIAVDNSGTTGNLIIGNYIGLGANGTTVLGNTHNGVHFNTSGANTVGSTDVNGRNIISSNAIHGIGVDNATGVTILGNYIGTDATGTLARGNSGDGIRVMGTSSGTMIGGTAAGAGNLIANNVGDGILVSSSSSTAATILSNSIYSNGEQGIDLGSDDGLTTNDVSDSDTGSNSLLNFPILRTATTSGTSSTITGNIRGLASTTFRVDFFRTPYGQGDASGYGEARFHLGSTSVTTNSSGNATFSAMLTSTLMYTGDLITATATVDFGGGSFGATSEFAGNILANRSNLMITGTYTGTGIDNRAFLGLGFRPEAVIVMQPGGSTSTPSYFKTASMAGDASKNMFSATALQANFIQSLDGGGFTVGTGLNSNAATYHWIAFGAGENVDVGAYIGNGTSQTVSTVGFSPEMVWLASQTTQSMRWESSLSTNMFDFHTGNYGTAGITAFTGSGFSVDGNSAVNQSGQELHYIAFNQQSNYFSLGSYVGNGVSNRNISGVGFEPELVMTRELNNSNWHNIKTESSGINVDVTGNFVGWGQSYAGYIQAIQSDGFQLSGDGEVNGNGLTYGYFAFKQSDAPLFVDTTNDTSDGAATSINALRANRGADGSISLREAIAATNATRNVNNTPDQIFFQINGTGVQTITVTGSDLGEFSDPIHLDATTQNGYSNSPLISIVDGDARAFGIKLWTGSSGSTVRGLNIQGFGTAGISIVSSNNTVAGNWVGINADGTTAAANYDGITIWNGDNNTIGGTSVADRNVISGNTNNGLSGSGAADGTKILGNYFGTDKDGLSLIANAAHGIWYGDSTGIVIGGNTASQRNIFVSDGYGIELSNTDNSFIQGNYIGLAANGSTVLGNDWAGVILSNGSTGNLVGTNADGSTDAAEGNVISGNYIGVLIKDSGTTGNVVAGNLIGTDATGTLNRGNTTDGVRVESSAANNTIGGLATAAGNTIAFNGRDGVRIESTAGTGNAILSNRIFSNSSLGINLVGGTENGFGVTANDSGDGDLGANGLQNMPVLSAASAYADSLTVQGSLNSLSSRTFRIEVFASTSADASGNGEGQRYLGTFNVTTDGSGNITFNQNLSDVYVDPGEFITLTATDLTTNNTSEFAAAMAAVFVNTAPGALAVTATRKGGLILNEGSGNDSYLIASDGSAIFGGRSQFTAEIQFSFSATAVQHTFLSYAVSGVDNEVYIRTNTDGSLALSIKGTSVSSSAVNFNSLGSGQNTLTVTWNNSSGAWQFFLNGTSFASGTGLQTGATLSTGGSLVIGHDQDSVAGGFQSNQAFKGTLFDVRIFNDVRTAAEVFSHAKATLPYNTSGLLANWTFDDLSTENTITDTVAGNSLTAQHASGTGFVADPAPLSLAIDEDVANGTIVGTIYGTDADREARITRLLAADSDLRYSEITGKFYKVVTTPVTWTTARANAMATVLNGVNGQLVTISSATENSIVLPLWSIAGTDLWMGASDQTTEGTWRWQNGLSDSSEFWNANSGGYNVDGRYTNWLAGEPNAPTAGDDFIRMNSTGKWLDRENTFTYAYVVEWNADDVLDATNSITYSITSQSVSGAFAINSDTGQLTVANSALLNFESQSSHTITVRVTDGNGATFDRAFTVTLNNLTFEATGNTPSTATTNEDTNLVFSSANGNAITVTDQNASANSALQVTLNVASGTLTLSQTTGLTFLSGSNGSASMVINGTESDINAALNGLTYAPTANFNGSVNLTVQTALASGLQGMYTFEGGNANDQSVGTAQNGTFVGNATTTTDATRGTVLTLDGNGDSVSIASVYSSPTNITIGGWVNLNTTGRSEFISLNDRVHIALDEATNGVKGSMQSGVGTWVDLSSQRFIAGTGWHHVMYVFDDTNNVHNLYIDGDLAATAANAGSIYWTGATTTFIGQHPSNVNYLNGKVDDVRIYDRALTAAEVAALAADQILDTDTVAITVSAVNDAPVMDNSGTMTLTTVTEDQTTNAGQTVASIIASASGDRITDIDSGAVEGIAITATNSGYGTWQFSTNNGGTWNNVGTVSTTSALLLRSTDLVRFVPNGSFGTSGSITFNAWDQTGSTAGFEGTKVNASSTGGTTAFSTASEVASITVTDVNDAPNDLYVVPSTTNANVLAYYSFSNANNLGRDDAGDTSPMTLSGSPVQTTRSGGSAALDLAGGASGQFGTIPSMTTGGAMTLGGWVKFDSTGTNGWERVIDLGQTNSGGIGNVYIGRMGTSADLTFTIEKNGVYTHRATAANAIANGTWMHVIGTVDNSGNMTLYINGVAVATQTGVAPDVGVRTNHYVGRSNWASDSAFDGAIDDLILANGAMSATDVASLYQQSNSFTLAENAANGTLITTFLAVDPDVSNTYTYALTYDQGGAFAINSTTGQLSVYNSAQLNAENRSAYVLVVQATDQSGASYSETVTINLTASNDAPTFSTGTGRNFTSIAGMQFGNAVAQQTDGKYVMVGWSDSGGTRDFAVVRYNYDGSLDTSFGSGNGYVITTVGASTDEAQDVRILSSGKILVMGYALNGGTNDIAFVQYNSDGSLDTSFGGGTGKVMSGVSGEDTGYSMAIQTDGKILVGGASGNDFLLARFNSDGSFDNSFGTSGRVTTDFSSGADTGRSVYIQADGKILLAGQAFVSGTFQDFAVARYTSSGSLDTTFNSTGRVTIDFGSSTDQGYSVVTHIDGTIIVGGFSNVAGTTDVALVRLTATGALDTTFNSTGRVTTTIGSSSDFAIDVQVLSDGKILTGGYASISSNDFALVRFNADGSLDSSFGTNGRVTTDFNSASDDRGNRMFLQADGRIVLSGATSQSGTYDLAIARYNADGSADTSFGAANSLGGTVNYTENGSAVILDSNVQIFDSEMSAAGNYSGATLTLVRNGGANSQDVFSATGALSTLTQGGNLVVSGVTIGTVTTNSNGTLLLTFNSNATQSRINAAIQAIAYSNNSDTPPASVQVNWTFNDANSGSQGTGGALTATGNVTVSITAVNDIPVIAGLDGDVRAYSEGDSAVLVGSTTGVTDVDSSDFSGGTLTVSITSGGDTAEDILAIRNEGSGAGQIGVSGGNVTFAGVTIGTWTGGTSGASLVITLNANANATSAAALINNITYVNTDSDSPTTTSRNIRFVLTDGDGGTSANNDTTMTVSAVNDAPVLTAYSPTLPLTENGSAFSATVAALLGSSVTDVDSGAVEGIAITGLTLAGGTLEYTIDGTNWLAVSGVSTSNALLLRATDQMRFTPSTTNGGTTHIAYYAWDQTSGTAGGTANITATGGTTAFSTATDTITVNVTSVNDAPVLDNTGTMTLTTITEDQTTNTGQTVDSIIASAGGDRITDVDTGAVEGIAIMSTSSGNGTWQYSINGGSNWSDVGTVSSSSALLLRGTDRVRFVPNGENATTADFTFRAWDQTGATAGQQGTKVNASTTGGTTPFSSATEVASISVTAINDNPTFISIGTNPQSATISITNDNSYNLYVNGVLLGNDVTWETIETYTTTLNAGDVVAIEGIDSNGAAAMIAAIDFANGARVVTGADWRISTTFETGWNNQGFDDSQWQRATSHGDRTSSPWVSNISADSDYGNLITANWIWASDVNNVDQVFFRYVVSDAPNVVENAANGTNVFRAIAREVDAGDVLSYSIQSQEYSGAFSIDAITGMISVANGSLLNFEADTSHTVLVRATDSGGLFAERTITIALTNVNESPTALSDSATAVEAGGTGNGTAGTNPTGNVLANDTDVDAGDTKAVSGVVAGTAGSASGSVGIGVAGSYGSITIASNGAFTYTVDNSNSTVQALRNSSQTLTDVFTYTMLDALGATSTTQITVTIEGVNDNPHDIASGALNVNENVTTGTVVGTVTAADVDSGEAFTYTLINSANGRFTIDNNGTITVADGSQLNFEASTNHQITVRVADTIGAFYDKTFTVNVADVNEAPVLDNTGNTALLTIDEDQTNNGGQTVASIIASAGGDRITDEDTGAVEGIAITSLSSGNGTWEYSLDGTNWAVVGTVADNSALLLRSTDYVRFVPNAQNATTAAFTFRAWDTSSGTAGLKVDSSTNGGATPFSTSTEIASIVVTDVNDAPTITNGSGISLAGTDEDTTSTTTTVSSLLTSAAWADVDSGALQGVAITGTSGNGNWQYFAGGTWTNFGAPSNNSSLLLSASTLIRYSPDGQNAETATFSFRAWDQSTGVASSDGTPQYASSTINGGTTAFSSQSATAQLIVSAVNDAANAVADTATADEAGGYSNATAGNNPSGNVLANDSDVDLGDTFSVTGVAAGVLSSATGNVNSSVSGTYGSIQIAANGAFTYTVDNNNSVVQALRTSGQTLLDTFTYTIQDTGGAFSSTQIVVTIRGANDAPTAGVDSAIAIEASGYTNGTSGTNPTGNVLSNDIDVDNGDTKTVIGAQAGVQASTSGNVGSSVTGSYGSITINASGAYTYVVDNSNAAVQALRTSSDTLTDVFSYTMQDSAGLASTTQITVTIQGGNDAPGAVDDTATATEAGGISNGTAGSNATGNVLSNDTDIDSGDTTTVAGVVAGTAANATGSVGANLNGSYGTINLAANGAYTYTIDNNNAAVQALRLTSNTLTELFTYTMTDAGGLSSTATLTITIQGANDNPVAVANTAIATEAGGINNNIAGYNPTGNVLSNDSDVDAADTKTVIGVAAGSQSVASGSVGASVAGTYGSIVINSDGTYTFTLDNNNAAVEALNDGQSLIETFTYTLQDSAGATATTTIAITIEGTDDLPFAVVDFSVSEEAGGLNNSVTGTDPTGNVFTNDITPNGNTLVGVAAGVTSSASGNVNTAVAGQYGSITIDSSGNFTYTLNNADAAVEALRTSGDHLTDIFTYTFEDSLGYSATTQVTVTIDGANDTPVSADDLDIAVEAGGLNNGTAGNNATGNVLTNDTDVDAGDSKAVIGVIAGTAASASGHVGASLTGTYGSIVLNSDGSYTYVIDQNNTVVQALRNSSQTLSELFTYSMEDMVGAVSTATLTITIQGSNDNPLAVADSATAIEAGGVNNGSAGTNPSGNVLSNDTDADSVANGETKTVTGVSAGTQSSATGNVAAAVNGSYGAITIGSNGAYTYVVDNSNASVQALRTSGNTLTDIFTYTVSDAGGLSSSTQITVTIQGANDTPSVTADTAEAIEAGGTANGTAGNNPNGNVLNNDSDADGGDSLNVSGVAAGTQSSASGSVGSSVTGAYGSLNIASDGTYVYVVDNSNLNVQALRTNSDTLTDVFTYTAQDASGATATTQITLTIRGRNDAPVGFADNNDAYEAGGTNNGTAGSGAAGNVITNDLEYDSGDTTTVTGVAAGTQSSTTGSVGAAIVGSYGSISIAANGSYSYIVDESNASVQALRLSTQTLDDVFSYTITDAAGLSSTTQITITLHGANDAPVASSDGAIAVEAGGLNNATAGTNPTGNVLTNDSDVDNGDTKTVFGVASGTQSSTAGSVGSSVLGSYGTIVVAADGSYSYTVDNTNAAVQGLRTSGNTLQDVFSYTVMDNAGLSSTTQITITIQGANDTPVQAAFTRNAISEDASIGTIVTTITATDVDSGDGKSFVLTNDAGGRFAIDSLTGVITVASSLSYEANTYHDIVVRVSDTAGATNDQSIRVFVENSNGRTNVAPSATVTASTQVNGQFSSSFVNDQVVGRPGPTTGEWASSESNPWVQLNWASPQDIARIVLFDRPGSENITGGTLQFSDGSSVSFGALPNDGQTPLEIAFNPRLVSWVRVNLNGTGANAGLAEIQAFTSNAPIAIADTATAVEAGGIANSTLGNNPSGNVLSNDTDGDSVDTKAVVGVASGSQGSASGSVGTSVTGSYGSIQIASSGAYTYTVDNNNAAVQALRTNANTLIDVFTYTMNDAAGYSSTTQITITIEGRNDTPHDLSASGLTIAENSANGTSVATITPSDIDSGESFTYQLNNDASGRFTIDTNTGEITVINSSLLDYESAVSHQISVRVIDASGAFYDEWFTVSLTDTNDFAVSAIADNDAATTAVNENAVVGSLVGLTAYAFDSDGTTNTITYSLVDDDGGNFSIDANTGVVTTAALLDRETLGPSRDITVRATSADGSTTTAIFSIAINDVDEFNTTAPVDTDTANDSVAENSVIGTTVGIIAFAKDDDATTNGITYSLLNNDGGRFTINATTGEVTVAGALNRELDGPTRSITIRATSSDGSFADQSFTINLEDVNEFDVSTPTDSNASNNLVNENAATGSLVGVTITASDADATNNSVTYQMDDSANGRFTIDSVTGVVSVADGSLLDFETATSHDIIVRATSVDGSFRTQTFTIQLADINESGVSAITDSNVATNTILENSAPGTTVGVTAFASDADGTDSVTYTLDDDAGGLFAIDNLTGVVTVVGSIDRELAPSYNIIVRATSSDTSTITEIFSISVGDVDEFNTNAVTDSNNGLNSVAENATAGTLVGITGFAFDADATNSAITYSLTDSSGGRFQIDPNTGIITVAGSIDRETDGNSRTITIRATSQDGSFDEQNFSISIVDVDEFDVSTPVDNDPTANFVMEDASVFTLVGLTAFSTDSDATTNSVAYSLDDDASGRFAIDSVTGIVTVLGPLDREMDSSYTIVVRAFGSDGSSATQSFQIQVGDVNEHTVGPVSDADTQPNTVLENGPIGSTVGLTASALDADSTNSAITYSLTSNPGGLFQIDGNSGIVTTAVALNRELHGPIRSITIRATSADGSYSEQSFTVAIEDADEFDVGVVSDSDLTTNVVSENATVGASVGITASAVDADATNNTIVYSLVNNDGGRFAIDSTTGVVTVAGAIDRELDGASRTITVRATSSDGSSTDQSFSIQILDVDEFDVVPVVDADGANNQVSENATIGTTVGVTASTQDMDATNSNITYTMVNSDGGRFAIDPGTGVVTIAGTVDREVDGPVRTITVRGTSADGSFLDQVFSINILDVNETPVSAPVDIDVTVNSLAENLPAGTWVGLTAQSTDQDATNNLVTYSLDDSAGGRFAIDSNTGMVRTNSALDFENSPSHRITVRATSSDGSFATADFIIAVNNINEKPIGSGEAFTTTYADTITVAAPGLMMNNIDPEGDTMFVSLITGPSTGVLIVQSDGSFSYKPTISFIGQVSFSYIVSDGALNSAVETVVINVTQPMAPPPPNGNGGSNNSGGNTDSSNNSTSNNSTNNTNNSDSNEQQQEPDRGPASGGPALVGPMAESTQRESSSNTPSQGAPASQSETNGNGNAGGVGYLGGVAELKFGQGPQSAAVSILTWGLSASDGHSAVDRLMSEIDVREINGLAQRIHATLQSEQQTQRDDGTLLTSRNVEIATKTAIGSGVVIWVARIGQIAAAVFAASSARKHIDPLSILNATKGVQDLDEAEKLFENSKSTLD